MANMMKNSRILLLKMTQLGKLLIPTLTGTQKNNTFLKRKVCKMQ